VKVGTLPGGVEEATWTLLALELAALELAVLELDEEAPADPPMVPLSEAIEV
jgi:hypothetical protein